MSIPIRKTGLIAGATLLAALCGAQSGPIHVEVNGQPVAFNDTQPRMINGRVLVPLRGVFEQMGAYVHWTDATQTVDATKGDTSVRLRIGDPVASVNGQNVALDVPPRLIGGSTMVPLRFVSESLGADVNWDDRDQLVLITTNGGAMANNYQVRHERHYETTTTTTTNPVYNNGYTNPNGYNYNVAPRISLPANAVIPATLDTPMSSTTARVGDPFTATVQTFGANNYSGVPAGSKIEGHVAMVAPQNGSNPGVIQLAFDNLLLSDGTRVPLNGVLTSLDSNSVTRDANGVLIANQSKASQPGQTPVYVGIGAGAGAVISMLTKGNLLTDSLIGGALGLLAHELQRNQAKPGNVSLNSGTQLGVRLMTPLVVQ